MSFTSPALLWLLPLAALPALLHLLARRRARELPFSSLQLLARLHAKTLPRARFKAWLLVLLRCLVLAGLVLAYAGPVLDAPSSGSGAGEGTDLVLLLDSSYSMGLRERGKTRFELAREAGRELLGALGPADRAAVVPFSDRLEGPAGPSPWLDSGGAVQALSRAKPTYRGTDFALALREAARLLSGSPPGRRRAAVLLSDGARHGARGLPPRLDEGILWLGLSWPGGAENASLAWAGPARDSDARSPRLSARLGREGGGRALVEVHAGGRLALQLQAGASGPLPPAADPDRPSWSGRAALRPDALPADDSYFFSFSHRRRPRALCLYASPMDLRPPAGAFFLRELFGGSSRSLAGSPADFLEAGRWREARLADYGLVLLSELKALPEGLPAALERFVTSGGGLWVVPGAGTSPDDLAPLSSVLPARLGPVVPGEGPGLKPGEVREEAFWKGFELSKVEPSRYFLLQLKPGARALFRSRLGYPLLAAGPAGRGRAALYAAPLDASWGNLALKPVFPSWVRAVLEELDAGSPEAAESFQLKVGGTLTRRWGPRESPPPRARLEGPEGRSATLTVRGGRAEHGPLEAPGLYELTDPLSGRRWTYAVNLDRSGGESEPEPLADPPWRTLRPGALAEDFRLAVHGRLARTPVLAGAALCLALEMVLSLPRASAAALLLLLGAAPAARSQQGDRLVWAQWRRGPDWDPYPGVHAEVLDFLSTVTSVLSAKERRVLELGDPQLFSSPVLVLMGRRAPPALSPEEEGRLRAYLSSGGFLWIEDVTGAARSGFDAWVRETLRRVLPEAPLSPLPPEHVLYKTFFLLKAPAGRAMVSGRLEGVDWGQRTAVVYSRNDVPGAWARDALGAPLHPCVPGGEAQRQSARKTAVNLLMYALTGSYKADAVHQPWLLQKLRAQEGL